MDAALRAAERLDRSDVCQIDRAVEAGSACTGADRSNIDRTDRTVGDLALRAESAWNSDLESVRFSLTLLVQCSLQRFLPRLAENAVVEVLPDMKETDPTALDVENTAAGTGVDTAVCTDCMDVVVDRG